MLSYTAYDVIRTVNTEIDLARPPLREHRHTFGDAPAPTEDHGSGGGDGVPITRALRGILRALVPRSARSAGMRPAHPAA